MSKQRIVIRKKDDDSSEHASKKANDNAPAETTQEIKTDKVSVKPREKKTKPQPKTTTSQQKSPSNKFLWLFIGLITGIVLMFVWSFLTEEEVQATQVVEIPSDQFSPIMLDENGEEMDYSKNILSTRSNLRQLLVENGVASADAQSLDRKAISSNINNLNPGSKYTVYYNKNEVPKLIILETKLDPYSKHVIDLNKFSIEKVEKVREIKEKSVAAIVETNLGMTFINNNLDLQLINKIEEIFAWSVDLFSISDGDRFKILYEEEYLDGKPHQIQEIKAAYISSKGEDYYAFRYNQSSKFEYYNEFGQSMKKSFLKTPIKYGGVITSGFGLRVHPVQNYSKMHYGTDFAAPEGTPIQSVADGLIVAATATAANGNYVKVQHDDTYTTQYLHMTRHADGMRNGLRVRQGDIIGYVGSTGLATGPHVCYRFWKNNEQVDPKKERVGIASQIDAKIYENYMQEIKPIQDRLSKVEYQ